MNSRYPTTTPVRLAAFSSNAFCSELPVSRSAARYPSTAMPQPARVAHCGQRTRTASSTALTGQNTAKNPTGRLTMPSRQAANTNKKTVSAGQIFRVSDNEVVCILDPETSAV
ncbi:hypothetical protein ACN6UB_03380 [Serratia marcescens]|uniref:hypothetical protein n=1 Tax=Serratia marcescens TaxID=615 RepID=UPI003AFA0303